MAQVGLGMFMVEGLGSLLSIISLTVALQEGKGEATGYPGSHLVLLLPTKS